MIVYGALVIPIIVAIYLYLHHREEVQIWEFAVILVFGFGCVVGSKFLVQKVATSDTEYWTGWATITEYYEPWDEEVPCTHTKYCTSTDSNGNTTSTACGTEHVYDVDYHGPDWQVVDSNGIKVRVGKDDYNGLVKRWGKEPRFVDLNRHYHSIDGDKYVADWPGTDETLEAVTTSYTYENRVQASTSVFNFPEVENPKALGLFDYPGIGGHYTMASILGPSVPGKPEAERKLSLANAKLGRMKQVRMWILIFKDQSSDVAYQQEAYWKRGNKNEFVLTIGIDAKNNIQWAVPFSWTEVESLKISARNFVEENKGEQLDLVAVVDWLKDNVAKTWVRKQFKDFSYLTVEPPTWAVVLAYLANIIVTAGISIWAVMNKYTDKPRFDFGGFRSRGRYR